jgi:hypothetical protein
MSRIRGFGLRFSLLFHQEQIVESSEKKVAFFRGLAPVAPLQLGVATNDDDDVHRAKPTLEARKEFESDGHESSAASCLAKRVADVQGKVATIPEDTVNLDEDSIQGTVVGLTRVFTPRVQEADASRIVAVADVRGIWGIEKHKIDTRIRNGQAARIRLTDIGACGSEIKADAGTGEIRTNVERCATAAHGIKDCVAFARVSHQALPDDPGWCRTGVLPAALCCG